MFKSYRKSFGNQRFECETNGVISNSIVQNWTRQALDCYKLQSDCSICPIANGNYSFKCQMKRIVDVLVKTQGLPDEKAILTEADELTVRSDIVA